jgi:hypothetical protein
MHHIQWRGWAVVGANPDSIQVSFDGTDGFGLPYRVSNAPTFDGYIGAPTFTYNYAPVVTISEFWAAVPPGITSVSLGHVLAGGNASNGSYVGEEPTSVVRSPNWNNGSGGQVTLDITNYRQICGRRIVYLRGYTGDSYFQGGIQLVWNIGSGVVAIPSSAIFGSRP